MRRRRRQPPDGGVSGLRVPDVGRVIEDLDQMTPEERLALVWRAEKPPKRRRRRRRASG